MSDRTSRMPHESFEVQFDNNKKSRPTLIRPERLSVNPDKCWVEINNTKYSVINLSDFGLAIVCSQVPFNENEISEGVLVYENVEVDSVRLKFARSESLNEQENLVAFEVEETLIRTDRILGIQAAQNIISHQKQYTDTASGVPQNFRSLVLELKDWLEHLEKNLNEIEKERSQQKIGNWEDYKHTIAVVLSEYFSQCFQPFYLKLSESLRDCSKESLTEAFSYFRSKMHEIIYKAPFANRVYNKPLGYAGDFEMMNIIYQNHPSGQDLFSQCLHKYFVEEPAASAVRNRAEYLCEKLYDLAQSHQGQTVRVLSVASGPSREVQLFIERYGHKIKSGMEFYFIDQDLDALKFAQKEIRKKQLQHGTKFAFHFDNLAIKNIIARGLPQDGFDLIYSAGLFDYLSDPVAQLAAKKLFDGLKSKGQLIIGNFSVSNPNQFTMDLALDWHLIYRSREGFKELLSVVKKDVIIEEESLGINLFALFVKD